MSWWKLTRVLIIEFEPLWYCLCGSLYILNSDVICKSRVRNLIVNFKSCNFLLTFFYFLRNLVLHSVPHDNLIDSMCLPISWVGRRWFFRSIRLSQRLLLKKYVYNRKHGVSGARETLRLINYFWQGSAELDPASFQRCFCCHWCYLSPGDGGNAFDAISFRNTPTRMS